MKYILLKTTHNNYFKVPTEIIALDRTKYYAGIDGFEEGTLEWESEMELSMSNKYGDLHDWITNNMDWKDYKEHCTETNFRPENSNEEEEDIDWESDETFEMFEE